MPTRPDPTRPLPPARPLLCAVNGQPAPAAEAVLPLREASWNWLGSASEVVQPGQLVRVQVVQVEQQPKSKVRWAGRGGWGAC